MIYLDYAATTPMSDEALGVYDRVASRYFGNTKSLHDYGTTAAKLLEAARADIAGFINAEERGLFFTGGGSDSNILAIRSLLKGNADNGRHLVTTPTEHSSLNNLFNELENDGYEVTRLPLDKHGRVDLQALKESLRKDTVLASIHHANSEIGTVQDLKTIGELLKEKDVLFHSDCVQTFGKLPIDVEEFGLDSLSVSSHKIYGPKGVGACYIRPGANWKSLLPGTSHEQGFRPGTLNTPGIAAFATAAAEMMQDLEEELLRLEKLRDLFLQELGQQEYHLEGHPDHYLPNIIGLRFPGIEGQYLMLECNRKGLAISTGSACAVGQQTPSRSMVETGTQGEKALEFVRFSLGKPTTKKEIQVAVSDLKGILETHYQKIRGV